MIIATVIFLMTVIIIDATSLKIGIRFLGYYGELDLLIVLIVFMSVCIVFIIDFIRYKFEWILLRIIFSSLLIFSAFIVYGAAHFLVSNKVMFYETPNQDTLFFVSEYVAGGLHHAKYKTTIYQKVGPMTYESLGKIDNFTTWLQESTIDEEDWFTIEFYDDYFIMHNKHLIFFINSL
jgi:hypothetical protein